MFKQPILIRMFLALLAMLIISACTLQDSNKETVPTEAAAAEIAVPVSEPEPEANPFAGEEAWIAYQTCRRDCRNGQIHLMRPDGTEDHQVAGDIAAPTTKLPDWSPDGTRLVVATQGGETEELYEYDLATDTSRPLFECVDFGPGCFADEPDWSPDGSKIAFINYGGGLAYSENAGGEVPIECDLYIGDLESGELTRVTENRDDCNKEYMPRWSPDGRRFVYTSDPYEDGRPIGTSVWVMNADGTGKRQLTDPDMITGEADWTADGQWIVFATYPLFEYWESPEPSNLYRIHPDGSGLEQLTFFESADFRATQPRPTQDGKWILFTADRTDGSRSLWALPNEGGEPFEIKAGGIYTHAVWQPQAVASAGEPSLTLRLAIPDAGDQERSFILEFASQVKALSGGEMTVEILWDAGADTEEGYELGVLVAVLDGDYELGLAASRIFEHEGITTFQPLQMPFLIDNEALAIAVAQSDVAAEMLDALSSSDLAGLTLWPEELRHPFSAIPGKPVLSPDDMAGQTVETTSEGVTGALIAALGGTPAWNKNNEIYQIAESGLRSAFSLSGRHIGTADVTFFPKYQVLFGNGEVFEGLNAEQQAVLREAAAAAQAKSLAERPADDAVLGAAYCRDGGTVVLAGEEQVAAFKEAAQPVVEMITADPANAEAVTALRELKENTVPSAGAEACAPAAPADPSTYANGVLNGTWGYEASEGEAGFFQAGYGVTADEVRLQLGFDNEEWWESPAFDGETFLENGEPAGDAGTFQIEDDRLITIGANGRAQVTFEWSLDGDQLTLVAVEECGITSSGLNCRDDRSQMDPIMMKVMEHTYTKISDSPRPWEE